MLTSRASAWVWIVVLAVIMAFTAVKSASPHARKHTKLAYSQFAVPTLDFQFPVTPFYCGPGEYGFVSRVRKNNNPDGEITHVTIYRYHLGVLYLVSVTTITQGVPGLTMTIQINTKKKAVATFLKWRLKGIEICDLGIPPGIGA